MSTAPGGAPELPKQPVTLNVLDVAGNLQLTQEAIESYKKEQPEARRQASRTRRRPRPSWPGKVKAQQQAGRLDIDLVLTGTDGLAAGHRAGPWLKLLPNLETKFPDLDAELPQPAAAKMQDQAEGQGVVVTYYPSGPLLEYDPDQVRDPPKTPEELLAWAKEHPGSSCTRGRRTPGPGARS